MQTLLGAVPPEKAVIAMSGICKLHLGEIVETGELACAWAWAWAGRAGRGGAV